MGIVYTEITLRNAIDKENAKSGILSEQEIRQVTVQAMVDTGAWTLAISEALVLTDAKETLLGAIPLEAMDLMVHPLAEEVVGTHGDQEVHRL